MIDDVEIQPRPLDAPENGREGSRPRGPRVPWRWRRRLRRAGRPRIKKLRLLAIVIGLGILAVVSTVFGMLMSVASDIPQIENVTQYSSGHNSYLYDDQGRPIGIFAAPDPEVIDSFDQISQPMRQAVVSVEDRRFWSDPGIDIHSLARALVADVTGGATQGASTITEQFVKGALSEEDNRTVLEKLREAALAFQLTHRWTPEQILTEYLNSTYFGNGAYGVESAARVYFGAQLGYDPNAPGDGNTKACGDTTAHLPSCASKLNYWQAATLAGLVASPSAFDPIVNPVAARARREVVLQAMLQQHYINRGQYEVGNNEPLPTSTDVEQAVEPNAAPYFTSWLRPQILAAMGLGHGVPARVAEYRAYYGGLKIRTTLDLKMQEAADQAVSEELPSGSGLPEASLVAIDNKTGQVRAMVGGPIVDGQEDYDQYPFNLATESERQPGSAFKPFTLAVALEHGFGPDSLFLSAPLSIVVPNSGGKEIFQVRNFGNQYSGDITLQDATDISDNSVFERLGWYGLGPGKGTQEVARMATRAGITTPVSTNPAMILGGLKVGVSPLDMAHAYETFATGGRRVYDPVLGSPDDGPSGIESIQGSHVNLVDHPQYERVMPAGIATDVHDMLEGVVSSGTGTAAAIPGVDVVGKTGTTTNYADAWFVGWTPQLTVAVWVGFPRGTVPMATLYNGAPVEGGTYPAIIWHSFMVQALQILASENPHQNLTTSTTTDTTGSSVPPSGSGVGGGATSTSATTPAGGATGGNAAGGAAPGTGATPGGGNAGAGGAGGTGAGGAGGTGAGGTGAGGAGGTGAGGTGAGGAGGTGAGGTGAGGAGGTGGTSGGSGGAGIGGG